MSKRFLYARDSGSHIVFVVCQHVSKLMNSRIARFQQRLHLPLIHLALALLFPNAVPTSLHHYTHGSVPHHRTPNSDMAAAQLALGGLSISVRPAEPLLASQLIGDQDLDELVESVCNINLQHQNSVGGNILQTGVKSLDDAFGGGIQSGRVVGVSGEAGAGGSEVSIPIVDVKQQHMRRSSKMKGL